MHKLAAIAKLGICLTALTFLLAGCGGGSSTSTVNPNAPVTGIKTPSKVSVANIK